MTPKSAISTTSLLLALFTLAPSRAPVAQTPSESQKSATDRPDPGSYRIHTYYLKTNDQQNLGDLVSVLRSTIGNPPGTSIIADYSQGAIVVRVNPADIPNVEKILADIDRPRKTYRVTYTLSEMDNNKRIGTQHFAVVMVSGQQTKFKQGTKIPIATSSLAPKDGGTAVQTEFNYVDADITMDATLQDIEAGGQLRYNLDQTSVAPEPSAAGPQNPLMRHTSLTGQATLTPGKPLMLGSIDFPGSTRRLDVEALMEPLP